MANTNKEVLQNKIAKLIEELPGKMMWKALLGIIAFSINRGLAEISMRGGRTGKWLSQGRYIRIGRSGGHGPILRIGNRHIDLKFFGH